MAIQVWLVLVFLYPVNYNYMNTPDELRLRLKEFGLTPEALIPLLKADLEHHRASFHIIKGLMDRKTRILHEVRLLHRELLLRALTFSPT